MKTSQIIATGALLAGYSQACTRVRVDQSRDQVNPKMKYSTITVYDDNKAPIGEYDFWSKIEQTDNKETRFYRQGSQVDVYLDYSNGVFREKLGGQVGFPQTPNHNILDLEQKAYFKYTNEQQIEHHIYCLWDNYNCGGYTCGI